MAEELCICAVCQNNNTVWYIDALIGGLYCFDNYKREIKCVISPMQMYQENYFAVRKLIYWNEKIIILPTEFDKKWIVYDIREEKLNYFYPVSFQFFSEETIVVGNSALCIPLFSNDPVIVLDLKTMHCEKKIDFWHKKEEHKDVFEIWNASVVENEVYFFVRNCRYWCKINISKYKMTILKMPEEIVCGDFCDNGGWALSANGKTLYKLDINGICLEKVQVETNQEFVRIIATYRYIFLLPKKGSTIYVYDQYLCEFTFINPGTKEINVLPESLHMSSYWNYIIEGEKIHFMPCKYPYLIVDLVTLEYKQDDFAYSENFSKKNYWNYYCWMQKWRQKTFIEESEKDLARLLNMIKHFR